MLFNASLCRNEDKSCGFPKFPMNILTWFKPTIELDGLMALMCGICQERGGWVITRQGWKKVGRDALGHLAQCQIYLAQFQKRDEYLCVVYPQSQQSPNSILNHTPLFPVLKV